MIKGGEEVFSIGDKVVYPMYGAGIIEGMEEKEIDGCCHLYYVMEIPVGNLKIMVSAGSARTLGLRLVHSWDKVNEVLSKVDELPTDMPENWNERYKNNLEKIKSGNLVQVLEVFRNLFIRESQRGLSSVEKKLLSTAKQIIVSEIVLSRNMEKDDAENLLLSKIKDCLVVAD